MLDLSRLKVFREVASRESFSRAAEALDYTQSAVSQQISALERDVGGLTLIERGSRPVRLTEAGRTLLARTDAILGEVATAESAMRALTGLEAGTLRIGGFASVCATLLPRAITLFAERHPAVDVDLSEMEPRVAKRMLRGGEIDLAVTYAFDKTQIGADDAGLEDVQLADDPFVLALPARHRLAGKRTVRLGELKDDRWVSASAAGTSAGYREFLVRHCREAGFEPQIAFEPTDLWTGRGIVAAGLAVSLMPQLAFTVPHPGVAITRPSGISPSRRIRALRVPDRRVAAIPPMLGCLTEAFAGHPPAA